MPVKVQSPLEGAPRTKEHRDASNRSSFDISCDVLTPERVIVIDWLMNAFSRLLILSVIVLSNHENWQSIATAQWGIEAVVLYYATGILLRELLSKHTFIKMTPDHIVTHPLCSRRKYYDRKQEHTFTVIQHDRAIEESRKHEKEIAEASTRGRVLRKKQYFQDSFIVVYVNGHTRVDLCSVYDAKEAAAILNRLVYCDRVLNQQLGVGGGFSRSADDQFGPDAGDL